MNSIVISGRLSVDPKVWRTSSQMTISKFSVAVDRFKNGEKVTDFLPCVAFGKQAEFVEKWLNKGKAVEIVGSLQTETIEKSERTLKIYQIAVDRISFALDSTRSSSGGGNQQAKKAEIADDIPQGFSQLDFNIPF